MIRFLNTSLKPISLFFIIIILFQCCKVYDKKPVTIERAINKDPKKEKRIKIEMAMGDL